jgi:hypothetical protein
MKNIPAFSPDWNEGRFFDLWMFVHLLAGIAGGFVNVFFGLTNAQVVLLGLLLMVLWELGELAIGVFESPMNRFVDIVVGLAGIASALWLAPHLASMVQGVIFAVTTAMALVGMTLGVRDYRRRKAAQERPAEGGAER